MYSSQHVLESRRLGKRGDSVVDRQPRFGHTGSSTPKPIVLKLSTQDLIPSGPLPTEGHYLPPGMDHRANTYNPTSPEYKAGLDSRSRQPNPQESVEKEDE